MAMTYGGMLYFPLKVNLFEEIAVELVEAKFGLKGAAAIMKLLCKIHKDSGYYLKWNEEQCALFTNKAGRDITQEEMQGIVNILVEKEFFDSKIYREKGVLTSTEIQKVWLEATKRRKRNLSAMPYLLETAETEKNGKNIGCTQNLEDCMQHADIFNENVCNPQQSKESKEKESTPPQLPPGKEGGTAEFSGFDIPGYAYNKKTHNLECLMLSLKQLRITDTEEIRKILRLSDCGRIGGTFWKIIHETNWNRVNCKGSYLIAALAKDRRC